MKLALPGAPNLTYCSNIHPGESWAEVRAALETYYPQVKARVSPGAPFGVGLRLSDRAARELEAAGGARALRDVLEPRGLYVFTVNAFPFGRFHQGRVKEQVYLPDWRDDERGQYTARVSRLLALALPAGLEGSVSTVPGAFREGAGAAHGEIAERLLQHAAALQRLYDETGRVVTLALEPEPACLLETTAEAIDFFQRHLHSAAAVKRAAQLAGLTLERAEALVRERLGVCLDACHAAVQFEEPGASLDALAAAGVRVCKVQLSSALHVELTAGAREALLPFSEGVYLHQVVEDAGARRFVDLPEALAAPGGGRAWRIHFHVPVFLELAGRFATTQPFLRGLLAELKRRAVTAHLEVETYTWEVLPEALRQASVADDVVRELQWVLSELA